ncbi:TPA: hypothetical protein QDB10_002233 [Burkholderia vietnamiensis]|nr:hypothetical protein [Burkholderia vietnamiensis]
MNILSKTGLLVLVCAGAFAGGYINGMAHQKNSQAKTELKAEKGAQQQTAKSEAAAQAKSVQLEQHAELVSANVEQVKTAVHRRVAAQINKQIAADAQSPHTESHDEVQQSTGCGRFYLDVGTVRLLNAARSGAAPDPAGGSDAAGNTAPALCFTDFVDADLELTKLYLNLAERHDALVDSVEQFQKEQRARLGIKEAAPNEQ